MRRLSLPARLTRDPGGDSVLFHTFRNQDERRDYGGSSFIEMQFCRLPIGTPLRTLIAVDSITDWWDGSLYIDDENRFYKAYSMVFDCGFYNNLKSGPVDLYGVNYYPPSCLEAIIEKIRRLQPEGHVELLAWLEKARAFNGFYILGI